MAEVEIPPEAPAWMLALEKKRQRVHRLAHEVGAGSPCLLCQDDCPGLDLHFWRKICRNCKCKKEDHNVIDDCGAEQFEILLGSGHSTNRPNKAFLEMLEKHTSANLRNQLKTFAFDWLPPDISPVIAAEYVQSLPASKLPVSGSDGALYRRQQLERQLPLHDLDASQCHQLTDTEVDNLKKYLENLKNNVVGQGRVTKLHVPMSNSLDSLSKIHTFNSVPKPFQSMAGDSSLSDTRPQFDVGGHINSGQAVHLKPPSAFWPKSLSPEPLRSLSPGSDSQLPSLADRGAAFGVTLSPAKGARPLPKSKRVANEEESLNANHGRLSPGHLVKDQTLKSVSSSMNVPGNMWVPSDCPECTRRGADGQLIIERVCTHIADSQNVPPLMQPTECTKCVQKIVDGKLVVGQVCPHISYSSDVLLPKQPSVCTKCVKKIVDGKLIYAEVCPHMSHSSNVPLIKQSSECTKCVKKIVDGRLVCDEVCPHISLSSDVPHPILPNEASQCVQKIVDGKLVTGQVSAHLSHSSDVPHKMHPSESTQCVQKIVDGKLVTGQVCPHVSHSSDVPHQMHPSECTKCIKMGSDRKYNLDQNCSHILNSADPISCPLYPEHKIPIQCSDCSNSGLSGQMMRDTLCPHLTQKMDALHKINPVHPGSFEPKKNGSYATELSPSQKSKYPSGDIDHYKDQRPEEVQKIRGSSPMPPELHLSGSIDEKQEWNTIPGLKVPSPLMDKKGSILRNKSPTSMMSSSGAPHTMALYAHNALNNPSSLEPQDKLSPHVAIMSLEDGKQYDLVPQAHIHKPADLTPVVDLKLHCVQCSEDISPGEVVVFADRAGPEVVWHPKCFVCNICQELLVDLVYFYNKGQVYCGRHYAEILDIPRCSACDELIFVKEYTVAEGQAFHVKHFCCFECDDPLGGKQYVPKAGQPICLPCYGRKYGKKCATCCLVIGAKDQGVSWKDLHWHATPDCFCCSFCQKSLLSGRFAVKDEKPFCCKECMQAVTSTNHQKVSAV